MSCFFPLDVIELFARAPAERIVFASDPSLRAARHHALHGAAGGRCTASLHRGDDAASVLGGTMASLLDGQGLPARDASLCRGSLDPAFRVASRVFTTRRSLVGPALFTGVAEQARAMLEMAIAACRDPEPDSVGEALDTIGAALERGRGDDGRRGGRAPRDRPVYRSIVRAATEIPD